MKISYDSLICHMEVGYREYLRKSLYSPTGRLPSRGFADEGFRLCI